MKIDVLNSRQSILDSLDQRYENLLAKEQKNNSEKQPVEVFNRQIARVIASREEIRGQHSTILYNQQSSADPEDFSNTGEKLEGGIKPVSEATSDGITPVAQSLDSAIDTTKGAEGSGGARNAWTGEEVFETLAYLLDDPDPTDEEVADILDVAPHSALNEFLGWIGKRGDSLRFRKFKSRLERILDGYSYQISNVEDLEPHT